MEEKKKTLPLNPIELLQNNDTHRRPDVDDADLWTADEIAALPQLAYQYFVPTLTAELWPKNVRRLSQTAYDAEFRRRDPLAAEILTQLNPIGIPAYVVVAGGAAAAPYFGSWIDAGDTDFFIVGIDPANEKALWGIVNGIFEAFCKNLENETMQQSLGGEIKELFQVLSPGVLTLSFEVKTSDPLYLKRRKYQVILRAFPSAGAAIHGFDVPSCSTYYDGRVAYSTTLGAYTHQYHVNFVNPFYRSITYEYRLAKYFERGYALAFVHLACGVFESGKDLELPHLTIKTKIVRGNQVTGTLKISVTGVNSDYETKGFVDKIDDKPVTKIFAIFQNLAQLASGENRFITVRCSKVIKSRIRQRRYGSVLDLNEGYLNIKDWYGVTSVFDPPKHPPTFTEIFPLTEFKYAVDKVLNGAYDSRHRINITCLSKFLGMTASEVGRFVEELVALKTKNPRRRIIVTDAIQCFKERLFLSYEAAKAVPIEWWIKTDPGRQYTVSLNPRIEEPREWYGDAPLAAEPGIAAKISTALPGVESASTLSDRNSKSPVYDGICAFCLMPLTHGMANTITLSCGHLYHASLSVEKDCRGFLYWMNSNNNRCPVCRSTVIAEKITNTKKNNDNPESGVIIADDPVRLIIAWTHGPGSS